MFVFELNSFSIRYSVLFAPPTKIVEENDAESEEKEDIIEDINIPEVTNDLNQLSLKELEAELEKAIKIENYVRAALLRDEIKIRK